MLEVSVKRRGYSGLNGSLKPALGWSRYRDANPVPTSSLADDLAIASSGPVKKEKKEMFYLTTHSTHFIYGYMASDIWLRTILIVRKETRCRQQGFFYMHHPTDRITHTTAFDTPALAGTRNSSMGPPHEGSIRRPTAP